VKNVFILDSSSIIAVREEIPQANRKHVFDELSRYVAEDRLVYPDEVYKEIERAHDPKKNDPIYDWVKKNRSLATKNGNCFEELKLVLREVPRILDPDKAGTDEADPYVLALAIRLVKTVQVKVLTQERRDRPDKMSMTTACGILGLPALPMMAFLNREGIWLPPQTKAATDSE
jgi:Domain of unknown function (DUF4411)